MVMICQCRFTLGEKIYHLVNDVGNEEGYACVGIGDIWEISVSLNFLIKLKLFFKKKPLKNIKQQQKYFYVALIVVMMW